MAEGMRELDNNRLLRYDEAFHSCQCLPLLAVLNAFELGSKQSDPVTVRVSCAQTAGRFLSLILRSQV
jgi:hypothetical protein